MTNMMNGAVAIYGGYGAMEIRQPLPQAVESVAQAVEDARRALQLLLA